MTRSDLQRLKDQLVKEVTLYVQGSPGFESWGALDYQEALVKLRTYDVIARELAEEHDQVELAAARGKVQAVSHLLRKILAGDRAAKALIEESLAVLDSITWKGSAS